MIDFSDFSDASGLNLNGDATRVNDLLGLTPAQLQKRGSAFFSEDIAIDADTSFETQFQFRLREGQGAGGADGFAFILQNSEAGSESLGIQGEGLGYGGITQSLAVEFDTYKNSAYDPNNNHISVLRDGNFAQSLAVANPSFDLNNGSPHNAWVDYDGRTNKLQVFVSANTTKPGTPLLDYTIDLASVLGSRAFVGFSAATGGRSNAQEIQSWKFSSSKSNPDPSQDISYSITTSNATLTEGNNGTKPLTFTVTRSGATQNVSSVSYAIGGSATNSSDYNIIGASSDVAGQTGTINFAANEASKIITLNVLGDTVVEPDETVQVTLSSGTAPSGTAILVTPSATTTITNDDVAGIQLSTTRVASGLANPLFATAPTGDRSRLFIVEQKSGAIKILDLQTNTVLNKPFLTIPAQELLKTSYEQGLLGLAFHPDYATNGKFYVSYTAPVGGPAGQTKVVEYRLSADDSNIANPTTGRTILTINRPEVNHNGGWLNFGKDGFLYWASGDGGGNGYQQGNQDLSHNSQVITNNLLGKILRIDVNGDDFPSDPNRNYAIPSSNPFVNKTGDDEIWAYGLRNPWRPTFDRLTGDFYIADVGQNKWEEINFQPASSKGGENYGWNRFEGNHSYRPVGSSAGLTFPIYEYSHSLGQSVTGGYVYRGSGSELSGTYFFGDFNSGKIWSFKYLNNNITQLTERTAEFTPPTGQGAIDNISSFGEDAAGNLYVIDYDGEIFRLNVG